jgi:hypothetical protein
MKTTGSTMIEDIPPSAVHSEKALQEELRDVLNALDQTLATGSFLVGNRSGPPRGHLDRSARFSLLR